MSWAEFKKLLPVWCARDVSWAEFKKLLPVWCARDVELGVRSKNETGYSVGYVFDIRISVR